MKVAVLLSQEEGQLLPVHLQGVRLQVRPFSGAAVQPEFEVVGGSWVAKASCAGLNDPSTQMPPNGVLVGTPVVMVAIGLVEDRVALKTLLVETSPAQNVAVEGLPGLVLNGSRLRVWKLPLSLVLEMREGADVQSLVLVTGQVPVTSLMASSSATRTPLVPSPGAPLASGKMRMA